jgi:hypothetical protein
MCRCPSGQQRTNRQEQAPAGNYRFTQVAVKLGLQNHGLVCSKHKDGLTITQVFASCQEPFSPAVLFPPQHLPGLPAGRPESPDSSIIAHSFIPNSPGAKKQVV